MRFFLFRGILIKKLPFLKNFVSNAYLNRRKFIQIPYEIFKFFFTIYAEKQEKRDYPKHRKKSG